MQPLLKHATHMADFLLHGSAYNNGAISLPGRIANGQPKPILIGLSQSTRPQYNQHDIAVSKTPSVQEHERRLL